MLGAAEIEETLLPALQPGDQEAKGPHYQDTRERRGPTAAEQHLPAIDFLPCPCERMLHKLQDGKGAVLTPAPLDIPSLLPIHSPSQYSSVMAAGVCRSVHGFKIQSVQSLIRLAPDRLAPIKLLFFISFFLFPPLFSFLSFPKIPLKPCLTRSSRRVQRHLWMDGLRH